MIREQADYVFVHHPDGDKIARYIVVPGGRLYQLSIETDLELDAAMIDGWGPPVFVPLLTPVLERDMLRQKICELASDLRAMSATFVDAVDAWESQATTPWLAEEESTRGLRSINDIKETESKR